MTADRRIMPKLILFLALLLFTACEAASPHRRPPTADPFTPRGSGQAA
jgi:hypothetical protein